MAELFFKSRTLAILSFTGGKLKTRKKRQNVWPEYPYKTKWTWCYASKVSLWSKIYQIKSFPEHKSLSESTA